MNIIRPSVIAAVLVLGVTTTALAGSINLNAPDFFADPTVTVNAAGTSALMEEDASFFTVLLSNDPFFDPLIPIFSRSLDGSSHSIGASPSHRTTTTSSAPS